MFVLMRSGNPVSANATSTVVCGGYWSCSHACSACPVLPKQSWNPEGRASVFFLHELVSG